MSNNSSYSNSFGQGPQVKKETGAPSFDAYNKAFENARKNDFPKTNELNKDIKFNPNAPIFGESFGMTDADTGVMAAKFETASRKAKELGFRQGMQYMNKTVELVLPTLTPQEIAFCVGSVIRDKMKFETEIRGGGIRLEEILRNLKNL